MASEEAFISAQLRESALYLSDAGFRETAKLLNAAADEIDMLRTLLKQSMPDFDFESHRANENDASISRKRLA